MHLKFYKRLSFKIYLTLFFIISLSVFFTTYLFLKQQEEFFISSLVKNGQALIKSLAEDSRYGVLTGDRKNLEGYVSGILTRENVTLVFIEDIKRNILLVRSSQKEPDTRYHSEIIRASQAKQGSEAEGGKGQGYDFIFYENKRYIAFFEPIRIEKTIPLKYFVDRKIPSQEEILVLGYVHVVFSLEELESTLARSKSQAFFLSLLLFLIFYLLAVFFTKKVVRPIYSLIEGTQHVAKGDFDFRIPEKPENEIGLLSESFYDMAQSLKEKHALEERIFAMEKIASLGRLAGGVSHEFNNILTSITTEAEASLDIDEKDYYYKSMENILDSARSAATITANLLNFSKPVKPKKEKIDIKNVLEKSLKLIRQELNNFGIRIVVHVEENIRPSLADPQQIQQVFINILANARDAMRNGGSLEISIKNDGDCVLISFADTGPGISSSDKKKIFEPFFTTKADYGESKIPGTGLGLTVSSDIIRSHGGQISIESKEGQGARVFVWLPAVNEENQ
ncbi:MAG: HAMP domain-containing protein, partial [Candidatus Aureabacteria bacterium]|nr:HAMP domain-containing protein [Candidatus Auribacterota bacterium]